MPPAPSLTPGTGTASPGSDGSMSLLVDMMSNTLDSSYLEASRRRTGERTADVAGPAPVRRRTVVPLLVVLGVLTGTAAAQVRSRAREVDGDRAALVSEVQRRTAQSDALETDLERLRGELAAEQDRALGASTQGQQAAERLSALGLSAGTVPVTGPGLVVRLDDAEAAATEASERGGQAGTGRVLDRDLQDAVNGLWAAGAEAVSVNDLRLTALTAIRSAGEAVLVDFRPLSPPYVLRAVGDAGALQRRFTSGPAGRRLATYPGLYGIGLSVERSGRLSLPAAGAPDLRAVAS